MLCNDLDKAQLFFSEFFRIYKSVGPAIMTNVAMVFISQNSHHQVMNIQRQILLKKEEELTPADYSKLTLTIEILMRFSQVTTKGTARLFEERVVVTGVTGNLINDNSKPPAPPVGEDGMKVELPEGSAPETFKFVDLIIKLFSLRNKGKKSNKKWKIFVFLLLNF